MHKHLTDAELDAMVVRTLSRLPRHAPSPHFADRVLARVQLPHPAPVVLYHRARVWLTRPRHALAVAGLYATAAIVALAVVIPWLLQRLPAIGFAGQWALGRVAGVAREALLTVAGWVVTSGAADLFGSFQLSGGRLWLAIGMLAVGYAGCAAGLHALLRTPRSKHVPALPR